MNVLINLATCKKGGGQNVALNFLESLERSDITNLNFYFAVVENTEIHTFLRKKESNILVLMPKNPFSRVVKEYLFGSHIVRKFKIDIIYTYFGTGLFPKSIPQISGSADSNLYYPEIDLWSEYSLIKQTLLRFIDRYRIWGLKRVKAVIFENESMQKRCVEIYHIENTVLIKPSISQSYRSTAYNLPENIRFRKYKGLFFCGWQLYKNFMTIPLLAAELKKENFDFQFIITAPKDNSPEHIAFSRLTERYKVGDMISIVGPIQKSEISSLYGQIDFVFLLSKLESFSNNIIEAWHFEKPLIISDELWSRAICKDAAIYVSRNDVNDIINKLISIIQNEKIKNEIILQGKNMLTEFPTIEQKTQQEIEYLKYIYKNS